MKVLLILSTIFLLSYGCSKRDWVDVGYDDGFAVDYNTYCKIRTPLVEGKWGNKKYAAAYERGYSDGVADCKQKRDDRTAPILLRTMA